MYEASYPITRAHKLKRIEEEFLRRLHKVDKPAYEVTAQQFFTYIAEEQQAEEDRLLLARPKKRNYYRTRITYETEKIMVQEAMNKPRWKQQEIADKYGITIEQFRTIIYKYNMSNR